MKGGAKMTAPEKNPPKLKKIEGGKKKEEAVKTDGWVVSVASRLEEILEKMRIRDELSVIYPKKNKNT